MRIHTRYGAVNFYRFLSCWERRFLDLRMALPLHDVAMHVHT
jgi:hypothetical protein